MTITVEDGSIVTGANSYVSAADLTAFAVARGITLVTSTAVLIPKSMDYIESLLYIGSKSEATQPLHWPRINVYIDGFLFDSDDIPQQLIDGQCQAAIAIDQGNDPLQDLPRTAIRKKVGEIEVEYSTSSSPVSINRKIINTLYKLLTSGGAGQIRVNKG